MYGNEDMWNWLLGYKLYNFKVVGYKLKMIIMVAMVINLIIFFNYFYI